MRSVVVLSGKGGVGKSSIAASLAATCARYGRIVCADCDVDASNLSLLFGIEPEAYVRWKPLSTNQEASIDVHSCIGCGACVKECKFGALEMKAGKAHLKRFACEGCGVCEMVCPAQAIKLKDIDNAHIGYADAGFPIAAAQLIPGSSGSGKVVFEVKKLAKEIGDDAELMIVDAAAGIGCPVIASVSGSDLALIVTEPTPSGYADMLRALEITKHFKVKSCIVVNKHDLDKEFTASIERFASDKGIRVLCKIPFDRRFVEAMTQMVPVVRYDRSLESLFEQMRIRMLEEL